MTTIENDMALVAGVVGRAARRLEGKRIIVTGAASGIGAESARRFAIEGAHVVCADINVSAAFQVASAIEADGHTAIAVENDVTDYASCEQLALTVNQRLGGIDGLYANAGVHGGETADGITPEQWRRIVDIDLTGAFLSAKAVLPFMLDQRSGSIVFQASVCATNGVPGTVAYSAAKAGLVGLGAQMAVEYGRMGVRVNCVSPGTALTQLVETLYRERATVRGTSADGDLAKTASGYPMGRLADVREIADAALFLLSDEASFITGTNLAVDGGFSAA